MSLFRLFPIVFLLAGCSSGDRLLSHLDEDAGFMITYPVDWHRAEESLTPALGFPMLVAIATFEPPPGGETCAHVAANALDAMGADDILLTVHELPFAYALGPRPDDLRTDAAFWEDGDMVGCMQTSPERLHGGQFRFFQRRRTFDVILAIGPEVSAENEDSAWAMLDSFGPLSGSE